MTTQKPNIAEMQKSIRQNHIHSLMSLIAQAKAEGKTLNKEKLVAQACLNWGMARRTILEYLKILELANEDVKNIFE